MGEERELFLSRDVGLGTSAIFGEVQSRTVLTAHPPAVGLLLRRAHESAGAPAQHGVIGASDGAAVLDALVSCFANLHEIFDAVREGRRQHRELEGDGEGKGKERKEW